MNEWNAHSYHFPSFSSSFGFASLFGLGIFTFAPNQCTKCVVFIHAFVVCTVYISLTTTANKMMVVWR